MKHNAFYPGTKHFLTGSLARISATAALAFLISGCWLPPATSLVPRNDLNATANDDGATGIRQSLLHFAHMSDVHIVDDANQLRLENIKLCPKSPYDLGYLDPLVQAISRDQDTYAARTWNAVVKSVNGKQAEDPFAFAMVTGDHTDTGLQRELQWFIDISDGVKSDSLQQAIDSGNIADFEPAGLVMPWYVAVGNHDVEYEGTVNNTTLILNLLAHYGDTAALAGRSETVGMYQSSVSAPWWHGFAGQPPAAMADSLGYYSFDPNGIVHCIVLNTAIFDPPGQTHKETFSEGRIDRSQFDWMVHEIEANSDRLCIIFSHHSPIDGFYDSLSEVRADEFMKALASHENVIAHINGHSHINAIDAVKREGEAGGYWNINTCAIIDWPQEWRDITVKDNGDGTGTMACTMVRHEDELCLDMASGDPDAQKKTREGTKKDRNVSLRFSIPAAVALRIRSL